MKHTIKQVHHQARALMQQLETASEQRPGEIKAWQDAYLTLMCDLLELPLFPETFLDNAHTTTAQGRACSPQVAAQCSAEFMRVQQFQRGIHRAIRDLGQPERPLKLLYAGTGPLGSLVVPLLLLLQPRQVQVTFLDIHADSLDRLTQLLTALELTDFIDEIVHADALEWTPAADSRYDLIVSETMKALFEQEPQISIIRNLIRWLHPDGTLIPQSVDLSAHLVHSRTDAPTEQWLPLGVFFQLNRHSAQQLAASTAPRIHGQLAIPTRQPPLQLALATDIQVYRDTWLTNNQCSLNLTRYHALNQWRRLDQIQFEYRWGSDPRFEFQCQGEPLHDHRLSPSSHA
ncbi:class I SAM-dependent methyltransferase [Ferrimonas sp. SCSIO 43195]|uniref:methyltransferase domain-containing protein n=1 Tax=Ferrimonas sp. SCSIO 43195 TaxID=2822844 RepID=UPI0020756E44|nr:class I SAM-dependent methyltransferase [Ferrimonas sp. SCSIO 43195]USD39151.1 class I SAM-dependent methyltransferase [Ferrimonas sp. SCSIO 43195]